MKKLSLKSTSSTIASVKYAMIFAAVLSRRSSVLLAEATSSRVRLFTSLSSTLQTSTSAAFVHSKSNNPAKKSPSKGGSNPPAFLTTPTSSSQQRRYMGSMMSEEEQSALEAFLQETTSTDDFFASPDKFPDFQSIGIQSPVLLKRVNDFLSNNNPEDTTTTSLSLPRPSAVQAASFAAINSGTDVNIGAETGSGKTLAYLLPLIDEILQRKKESLDDDGNVGRLGYDYGRAIILVPNKELVNQVVRMAMDLCGGPRSIVWSTSGENTMATTSTSNSENDVHEYDIVRLGVLPGGLKTPEDYKPFRLGVNDPLNYPPLDLIITTPASLGPMALNPKNIELFADVQTLVIDEADMLFDGGYLRQLENVLLGFRRADRLDASFGVTKTQHVLAAATLPNMGLKSADAYVQKKFPYATCVTMSGMHNARHYGLKDRTEWIQDDYDEEMPKKRRMEQLIEILDTDDDDLSEDMVGSSVGLKGGKIIVFLNSASDVDNATGALQRAGINAVPFHAKISLAERTDNLNRFRQFVAYGENNEEEEGGAVPILVCTDLAARGLDIPGVTSVVQLQFAGNVVSHLHRMGRCGRAGNRNGRGVVFYGDIESELVEVVRKAEEDQETMVLKGNDIEDFDDNSDTTASGGKVQNAFSRKRGFTKKRKKTARKSREEEYENF